MKFSFRFLIPCLALTTLMAACEDKNDQTGVVTTNQANVRFVNAVSGVTGNVLLTANGSAVGTGQAFGNSTTTCSAINSGSTAFAFGTPSTGGTTISTSLGTLTSNLTGGGNYYVIATGTSTSPTLMVVPAISTTTASSGNANIQLINATNLSGLNVFANSTGTATGTATTTSLGSFSNGGFYTVPTTSNKLTFTNSTGTVFTTSTPLNLTSGGNYTVLLLPTASGTGYQTVFLSGTC